MRLRRRFVGWIGIFVLVSCHRAPEPERRASESPAAEPASSEAPSLPPSQMLAPPLDHPASSLTWSDPAGWSRVPSTSPMRLATYRVPGSGPDAGDGELTVFHFGRDQGGDVESNFTRWEKQFSETKKPAKRTERTVNGLPAHVLEIEDGTFASSPMMMPGAPATPKAHYGMLGAIVEAPDGPYFFKLTGPAKTLAASEKSFFDLIDSAKPAS